MNNGYQQQLSQWFESSPEPLAGMSGGEYVVYGAGGFGRLAGKLIEQAGGKILFFLDKEKKPEYPWPVKLLKEVSRVDPSVSLVIGVFNAYVDIVPVVDVLKKHGFSRIITPVELFKLTQHLDPPSQYWLAKPSIYTEHREAIIKSVDYFSDAASKELFVSLWRHRLHGKFEDLLEPSPVSLQYFAADVPPWKTPLRLIDCGAYTGDTLHYIQRQKIPTQAVAAFEPDPENYKKLVKYFGDWPEVKQCVLIPCGVYQTAAQLKFAADGAGGSSISENGNITIQCVSIDECLPAFHPNLIKMDIEGAEMEALRGAEKTIRLNRPGLAISLYHTPHHLWQIPKLLSEWQLGYTFYLRTHLYQEFDTVLYAIPDNH